MTSFTNTEIVESIEKVNIPKNPYKKEFHINRINSLIRFNKLLRSVLTKLRILRSENESLALECRYLTEEMKKLTKANLSLLEENKDLDEKSKILQEENDALREGNNILKELLYDNKKGN